MSLGLIVILLHQTGGTILKLYMISGLVISVASIAVLLWYFEVPGWFFRAFAILLICSLGISAAFYGRKAMDHYSLRRIEFKNIALWYADNENKTDVLLITEKGITQYYSGLPDNRFCLTDTLKSKDIPGLIAELKKRRVTMIFIDDFYIKRLAVKDKNSAAKKAALLLDLRENYSRYSNFGLIRIFKSGDTTSYLLSFTP